LVIGIGINVNNSWRSAPRDVVPHGAALCDITGSRHDLHKILVHLLQRIQERLIQLASGDQNLPKAWHRLCWLTGLSVDVSTSHRWVTGVCAGIDRDGALIVEDFNGPQRIHSGSVRVLT
jgi:biotin-(acetyl-CoA carboxylase) ligase